MRTRTPSRSTIVTTIMIHRYCILELATAIEAKVPIVALNVKGKDYDFEKTVQFLTHLDTELEQTNPGAIKLLKKYGLDPVDAAYRLSNVVPQIISVPFDSCASQHIINATLADLMEQMRKATPVKLSLIHI